MAEDLHIRIGNKTEQYEALVPQIIALIGTESDFVANMANVSAALMQQFSFLWVGFYLVRNDVLVLGPFQGPVACTRISHGRGVCGTSWAREETLVVPDVNAFPGHIACSSLSQSEIVVPLIHNNRCIGVLDIDSAEQNTFDATDTHYLGKILKHLLEVSDM